MGNLSTPDKKMSDNCDEENFIRPDTTRLQTTMGNLSTPDKKMSDNCDEENFIGPDTTRLQNYIKHVKHHTEEFDDCLKYFQVWSQWYTVCCSTQQNILNIYKRFEGFLREDHQNLKEAISKCSESFKLLDEALKLQLKTVVNNPQGGKIISSSEKGSEMNNEQNGEMMDTDECFESLLSSLGNNEEDSQMEIDNAVFEWIYNSFPNASAAEPHASLDNYVTPEGNLTSTNYDENSIALKEQPLQEPECYSFVVCHICSELIENDDFQHHMILNHTPKKCSLCSTFVTDSVLHLDYHIKKCHLWYKVCLECSEILEDDNFQRHILSHMSEVELKAKQKLNGKLDENDYYPCKCCTNIYSSKFHLDYHFISHLENERKENICKICCTSFIAISKLNKHLRKVHFVKINQFPDGIVCMICYCECDTEKNFVKHLKNCHQTHYLIKKATLGQGISPKSKKCTHCDMSFKIPKVLAIHKTVVHEEAGFTCRICSKQLYSKGLLDIHISQHGRAEITNYLIQRRAMKHLVD